MIDKITGKVKRLSKRKLRSKKHLKSSIERPRMCVVRSNKYLYVQVINDIEAKVICAVSSVSKELKDKKLGNNIESAKEIGKNIALQLKELKIEKIVFDRNGYLYHGKIKALADACRKEGIEF